MPNEDHRATGSQPKNSNVRRGALVVLALISMGSLLFTVLMVRNDDGATEASESDAVVPAPSIQTTTTVVSEAELISRLKEI
jgi:hypothetical protein